MSQKPKLAPTPGKPRRVKQQSGVKTKAVTVPEPESDPFAEFHDGWEPVRRRKSQPPGGKKA